MAALLMAYPATAQPQLSAADYVAAPSFEDPQLSPDGAVIAARTLLNGKARLALFTGDAQVPVRAVALPEAERLEWHRWIAPGRLLVSLAHDGARATKRLAVVDTASGSLRQLGATRAAGEGDDVIHIDRAGRFLLLRAAVAGHATPGVERIDLASGATTLAVAPQPHVWQWYADSAGVVRAGMGQRGDRSWLLYRQGERDAFSRARGKNDARDGGIERIVPVRGSDRGYAMAETPGGRIGLYAYDFGKARLGALLFEDDAGDLDGFETDADGQLTGAAMGAGVPRMRWFDDRLAARQKAVDAALPGRVNRVEAASADGTVLLVRSESAGDPGSYYRVTEGRAAFVGAINARLAGRAGSEMRSIAYRARDGLAISGYLTLPAGRDAHGLPVIVMPHGGPFANDSWGYDPWVQYLADRGYAVLQPNYRGSTGLGADLVARGDGEWGRGMQTDLDDGLAWLAAQGIVDPKRACIMGASYGGYAALWAAAQDAGTWRCAISFAGISDVKAQLDYDHKTFAERDFRAWRQRILGHATSLDSLSPLSRAAKIRMPLLIAHGTADETVPPGQSERLHAALGRLGRPHDYVAYPGEGHTLEGPDANADFLQRVGKFLDANNPS